MTGCLTVSCIRKADVRENRANDPQSCLGCVTGDSLSQHLLDHAQEDRQYRRDRTPVVSKEITQPLRQR